MNNIYYMVHHSTQHLLSAFAMSFWGWKTTGMIILILLLMFLLLLLLLFILLLLIRIFRIFIIVIIILIIFKNII